MPYNNQTEFLFVALLSMNGTSYLKKSWMHRQSTHSKTGWRDTGEIWAFSAEWIYSSSISISSTSTTVHISVQSLICCNLNLLQLIKILSW